MNRSGAAGRRGTPGTTLAAFLDHYTYTAHNSEGKAVRAINGAWLTLSWQRSIRRWRNGDVKRVSVMGLAHALETFGFETPWFHKWAKDRDLPVA